MTREEIIAKWAELGARERDAWVGEVITHITPEYDERFSLNGWRLTDGTWTSSLPQYTTDISAAWTVLAQFKKHGVRKVIDGYKAEAENENDGGIDGEFGVTAAEAIGLVALVAKLTEVSADV